MSTGRALDLGAQLEGQVLEGRFRLQQYLGGSPDRAAFMTQIDGSKATIKLVLASSVDPEAQFALWHRAAGLTHPHLIRILDSGRSRVAGKDILYIVSEYADENLGQVLPTRALNATEAEAMLRPTLDALAYLHSRGLVHARLRPSNVMAVYDQLKLSTDRIQSAGSARDKSPVSIFDAPETIEGRLFPATDVWSLGVTLAEALTEPSSQKGPEEASSYWDLPQPFADIVSNCLQRDSASRWKLDEVRTRLRSPMGEKSPALSLPPAEEAEKTRRRWPLLASMAILLVAIAAITLAVLRYHSRRSLATSSTSAASAAGSSPSSSDPVPTPLANSDGSVQNQVLPNPSQSAKNTIHGRIKVRVKVAVDPAGQVADAKFTLPGPSKYFARLAMEAAERWQFSAPTQNGQPVASEWNLVFEFARGGTSAQAQRITPSSAMN